MAAKRSRRKKTVLPLILMLAAVALIIVLAGGYFVTHSESGREMDKRSYYGITGDSQAALVVNDKVLDAFGLVRDGRIYLDYDTVSSTFNGGFFWEEDERQMLLTMPSGTLKWSVDESEEVILIDDTIYISADCVMENSDIDMEIFDNPSRIVARTNWKNIAAETMVEDAPVRFRGGPKSEILTRVKAGDTVVLTAHADDWCEVSTADGYIGYVKKKQLKTAPAGTISHTTDKKFLFKKVMVDHKINLAWHYIGSVENNESLDEVTAGATGLNTIAPTWFKLADENGNLISYATADYVTAAHNKNMQVWGTLQDVYGDGLNIENLLKRESVRETIINSLLQIAAETGMDGINVDIETIGAENVGQYLQFLRELSVAAHEQNLTISVDNYVPLYTTYLNRGEQAKTVDYLVIMGYDEHTAGSVEVGSNASLPFVKQGIEDTLSEVSKTQVINAIPFYTRAWTKPTSDEDPSNIALGMDDADLWVQQNGIKTDWDASLGQYKGSVETHEGTLSIWLEEEKSIEEKMKLINSYDLAGVAEWRLGFERSSVWGIINKYLNS